MAHNRMTLQQQAREVLASLDPENLTPKQRLAIPQQEMAAQDPNDRIHNMNEVALGYTPEQARLESLRCLQCKNAPCIKGCPVSINIPAFLAKAAEGDFAGSVAVIKENSLLPAICGRVCPQEEQCQLYCTVGKTFKQVDKSVSIGRVERFVADYESTREKLEVPKVSSSTGKKVAVIGSGPASITAAADIRREGHEVVIFEAFHKPGGVMIYGIPEFRLPKSIVAKEIENLKQMGVQVRTNFLVGRTRKLIDLIEKDGFNAVFVGSGAGLPKFMHIEGENLVGVFSANEYLTRSNLLKAYDPQRASTPIYDSKVAAVLGGGNVAMDAARTAKRLGTETVYVVYRRTEQEMPARKEEVEHAQEEGIEFVTLHSPKQIIGDADDRVTGLELLRYELGEPDESGRRRPIPVEGSERFLAADTVIVSIGNDSNPLLKQTTKDLNTNKWGNFVVDENLETSLRNVFAGGDIVLGAATVILAMGQGRKAAASINERLKELS